MRKLLNVGLALLVIASALYVLKDAIERQFFKPTDSSVQQVEIDPASQKQIEVVAKDLDVPWGIAVLPDGDMFVTERPGTLQRIGKNGQKYTVAGVEPTSEGGLLGVAIHPKFATNGYVYLYFTTIQGEVLSNRIERFTYKNDKLQEKKVILADIPAARNHDGGRLAFGPDSMLYVTTGDAQDDMESQNKNSLAGKILRLTDEGKVPSDNPFNNFTYAYGFRNPQGIAWDDQNRLWAVDHGPSGVETGNDELNLVEAGANYGWPIIRGMEFAEGMKPPVAESGTEETWAPAGLAYQDGSLYFTGLRGERLYRAELKGETEVKLSSYFAGVYGRLRTVHSHDNSLLLLTSNTDGRGEPKSGDDHVYRVPLSAIR